MESFEKFSELKRFEKDVGNLNKTRAKESARVF
jgi:hypothetical protein